MLWVILGSLIFLILKVLVNKRKLKIIDTVVSGCIAIAFVLCLILASNLYARSFSAKHPTKTVVEYSLKEFQDHTYYHSGYGTVTILVSKENGDWQQMSFRDSVVTFVDSEDPCVAITYVRGKAYSKRDYFWLGILKSFRSSNKWIADVTISVPSK